MKYSGYMYLVLAIALFGCAEPQDEPFLLSIPTLPEDAKSYFKVSNVDTVFQIVADSNTTPQNFVSMDLHPRDVAISGSSLFLSGVGLEFHIRYDYDAENRVDLIHKLIQPEQDLAFKVDLPIPLSDEGFSFEVVSINEAGGGIGYRSSRSRQPETSFLRIENSYRAVDDDAIWREGNLWLEGSFRFQVMVGRRLEDYEGSFLLNFGVCCYRDF